MKKNTGFEVVCLLRELLDDTVDSLSLTNIFEFPPVVYFKTTKVFCPGCHMKLKVHHTDTRKVCSLHIGLFNAHRTFMYCPDCNTVYPAEEFGKIVPPYSNVGYDVIIFIGRLIFQEHHTINETVLELKKRDVHISSSQVAYLAQRFIVYQSILHQQSTSLLKMHIIRKGAISCILISPALEPVPIWSVQLMR